MDQHDKGTVEVLLTVRHTDTDGVTRVHSYQREVRGVVVDRPRFVTRMITDAIANATAAVVADFDDTTTPEDTAR